MKSIVHELVNELTTSVWKSGSWKSDQETLRSNPTLCQHVRFFVFCLELDEELWKTNLIFSLIFLPVQSLNKLVLGTEVIW